MEVPRPVPVDEFHHIDYAAKVVDGALVGRGDRFGTVMMREFSCRRLDASAVRFDAPPCDVADRDPRPERFPENGFNTAYIHPPTYYVLSAAGGSLARWVGGSFVTGARLANVAWLWAFIAFAAVACRWTGVSPSGFLAVAVLLPTVPASLHAFGTVNPDAAGLACGAAAVVGYLAWSRGRGTWWLVLAAAPVLVKSTHALASTLVVGLVAWDLRDAGRVPGRGRFRPLAALVASLAVGAAAVVGLRAVLAHRPASVIDQPQRFRREAFPIRELLGDIDLVPPFLGYTPSALRETATNALPVLLADGLFIATVLAVGAEAVAVRRRLVAAALVQAVLAGPMPVCLNFVMSHIYVPSRTGTSCRSSRPPRSGRPSSTTDRRGGGGA